MTLKKLNNEELDIVTGGNFSETHDLFAVTGVRVEKPGGYFTEDDVARVQNWLKTKLNVDSDIHKTLYNMYSIKENGVTRKLTQKEVMKMAREYRAQHSNG